ncbi:hypothetical protein C0Q70_05168 [Pomacea canaliculata]|uniref:Fucosyltransferase n=1 Tax=Pomacea canaliculata TaxID=400727 RepID=A0A2T7PKE5_POMCA|nr:hypothetical protein C0Q70_05168 [Pomacea canaliculata]
MEMMRNSSTMTLLAAGSRIGSAIPGTLREDWQSDERCQGDSHARFPVLLRDQARLPGVSRMSRCQIWAYFAVEAPPHSYSSVLGSPAWRLYFNWTMTYRLDSDIRFGYGIVVKTSNDSGSSDHKTYDESALMKKIRGKSKMAAILVSNCDDNAQRLSFLKLLKKAVPGVDVYGTCGSLSARKD